MKESSELYQDNLNAFLAILSQDREEAGKKYEELRNGLVRYFMSKGCSDSLNLADETLTRVATKATAFDAALNVKPSTFVYGFASRVFMEYLRRPERKAVEFDPSLHSPMFELCGAAEDLDKLNDRRMDCLDKCLSRFSSEESSLIVRYYSKEKREKIDLRMKLALEVGCSAEALHMRVHRMRNVLRNCISRCLTRTD